MSEPNEGVDTCEFCKNGFSLDTAGNHIVYRSYEGVYRSEPIAVQDRVPCKRRSVILRRLADLERKLAYLRDEITGIQRDMKRAEDLLSSLESQ